MGQGNGSAAVLATGATAEADAVAARLAALPSRGAPAGPLGPCSDGRWRWAVDAERWRPCGGAGGKEFQLFLGLLPAGEERDGVLHSPNMADRKRALLGRLLARRACSRALGFGLSVGTHSAVSSDCAPAERVGEATSSASTADRRACFVMGRTYGRKPFLQQPLPEGMPNFNFNVSHDGRWVVLASDPLRLVGIDVSAPQRKRGDREDDDWFADLANLLSEAEQDRINREVTVRARYAAFQRIWSAKESVTKATGQGVDFGLERIEVTLDHEQPPPLVPLWLQNRRRAWKGNEPAEKRPEVAVPPMAGAFSQQWPPPPCAEIVIDLWPRAEWELVQHSLADDHWVTVALGPAEQAVDRNGVFVQCLRLRGVPGVDEFARRAGRSAAQQAPPQFEILPVAALVPPELFEAWEAARAADLELEDYDCY